MKTKILCVEDEIDIRANIAEILRDEGYEVIEAGNGLEGYETFLQERPNLIISDIMMPELDGYGFLKLVRETKGIKDATVPFILLTALGQKESVLKGIDLRASDYLVKPIDFDLLIAKVKEKSENFQKIENVHNNQIQNIKNQLVAVLPKDVFHYLDIISQIATNLKNEPFGPLPHKSYLEEIKKIYLNCVSLRSVINNSLDENIIDFKLKANEEILSLGNLFRDFANSQNISGSKIVSINNIDEIDLLPHIKIDRFTIEGALKNILNDLIEKDRYAKLTISAILDHLKQIVIIFYIEGATVPVETIFDEVKIAKILDNQNCRFEVFSKKSSAIISIPEYRIIPK